MKAFTLILVVAVITDCLGAQSDRSRQRSGPIRSVPVAADIKRDVNFDCPEEFGYYPHPTDCSLYYVCVFGGALLESCTGGLMYSHELQTCDWPRNVGCDATGAVAGEELERVRERAPQSVSFAPRRPTNPPPPPPRVQPNPVVTSRGQPKFSRDEYEKQQQLYADVDDLPPVEELESDRQQRVYRGQPSTIGEVQKQRDGYVSQSAQPARNFNSNIIPASIPQNNGKIGSFSFGSQVDERRAATATPAPQSYSLHNDNMTDPLHDRQSDITKNKSSHLIIESNEIKISRKKREIEVTTQVKDLNLSPSNSTESNVLSKRSDSGDDSDFFEMDSEYFNEDVNNEDDDEEQQDDIERGKRQTQHYQKHVSNAYKQGKRWSQSKPNRFVESPQFYFNPQDQRQQPNLNSLNNKHFFDDSTLNKDSYYFPASNPFASSQIDNLQSHQRPFKPSLPDHYKQAHNPMNSATQIITKSPPISTLRENPFASLAGGFYNNNVKQSNSQNNIQYQLSSFPRNQYSYQDSSQLSSAVVTGKPVLLSYQTSNRPRLNKEQNHQNEQSQKNYQTIRNNKHNQKELNRPYGNDQDYEEENPSEDDESFDDNSPVKEYEDEDENNKTSRPPFEYRHPTNKYANIKNPFEKPDFDFDDFLEKLRDENYSVERTTTTTSKPINKKVQSFNNLRNVSNDNPGLKSSTLKYFQGMSTPRPFSVPLEGGQNLLLQQIQDSITAHQEKYNTEKNLWDQQISQQRPQKENNNDFKFHQQSAGTPLETLRPKLKPPNFKDDRQLPISYSFSKPIDSLSKPANVQTKVKENPHQIYSVTQEPFLFVKGTPQTLILSTPNHKYMIKPQNIPVFQTQSVTGKPYLISSIKPIITFKQSTPKPITTLTNEQISAFRQFWNNNPSTESQNYFKHNSARPSMIPDIPNLESLFSQAIRSSTQSPVKNLNVYLTKIRQPINTTTQAPKRRPIPKPSPEMNDYYYDEDEYYEPPVKSQYMPSTEVKPQRPLMAQNDQEYEDSYEDSQDEKPISSRPQQPVTRKPVKQRPDPVTKNHNDVSAVTKAPTKNKNINGKIPVPVMVGFSTLSPMVQTRPEISNYKINHHGSRNRTVHIRKPGNGPNTVRPPKFLNQTTLRPYTVRHRLAKPTTVKYTNNQDEEMKIVRGQVRHQNIVTSMKFTTPRYNSETRYTKSKLNNKLNSLEPTESVAPVSFSPSPRPKMLYNGSQSYNPDHYDPYYAVYDEDGELYKDNDYVQQYNSASLRPAVQQTYRGTPPPARRPEYTPRPSLDDYDDALIQGQINNNQNQYQAPIRQSTRGEGNELGYDHIPSSVRTTVYEATTPISTTPSTTSTTTTTTQRPTSAPLTEAMPPSRISLRSSTDEIPIQDSEPSLKLNSTDEPTNLYPSTLSPSINISSLAKPFEKTDNSQRLKETLPLDDADVGDQNSYIGVDVKHPVDKENKKVVSLTSGFSIRRNPNNTHNPYTLTVLTRPYEKYHKTDENRGQLKTEITNYNDAREESIERAEKISNRNSQRSFDTSMRRSDTSSEIVTEADNIPIYVPTNLRMKTVRSKSNVETTPPTTKYYLKTVIKRPAPFSSNEDKNEESTENTINTDALIETALQNVKLNSQPSSSTTNTRYLNNPTENSWKEPAVSPYRTLNNLRKPQDTQNYKMFKDHTSTISSTTTLQKSTSPVTPREVRFHNLYSQGKPNKPSYYSYHVTDDDDVPDTTTEVFSGRVKNVLKAFFNNFVTSNPKQKASDGYTSTSPTFSSSPEEKTVNIGFQKKKVNYDNVKPVKTNVKRVEILSNSNVNTFSRPINKDDEYSNDNINYFQSSTPLTSTAAITRASSQSSVDSHTTEIITTRDTFINNELQNLFNKESLKSRFNFATTRETDSTAKSTTESPSKFQKIIKATDDQNENNESNELTNFAPDNEEQSKKLGENDWSKPNNRFVNEIASTTSTTKMTMTTKADTTSSTKSLSFPTRATRVNAAIKQAATNPGGGRRSYQSSSKCSSDNSLQANPKCNEIKYQRPSGTRGRGSAHYSTLSESAAPQQNLNRGTPPTRSRPTLKPSTSIVSKSTEFVDIYNYPAGRPAPVYPQPTPDKTAAKCRKDVCLLPDCYCGGKDIPGDMPVESVPQIVLLTFDDSVNDLNKGLYTDLFEKGRVNPNGCPISATFYVSHEWTDYSQVQNLYSAGHEMASHTISHSFGEQFSQKKWNREVAGQREILAAYGGVKLEDVRGMRAPFLSVGGNKMFKMLYDSNFTYDSSMPVYENRPPSWPYTLDYKLFHDCMIPPCPTKSYPGVWEVPMVMWQDLNGGRCSMGDACANPPEAENVYKMLFKNFDRHYTTNRAPFGLFYHAAWFTQPHHKEGFIMFLDAINQMQDVWIVTNWQALQWVRDPTPISRINNFQPFQCNYQDRPKKCNNPKVCNLWHKSGVRYMRTCQPCPEIYPWTGKTGIRSSRIDNDIEE